jgi:hypothetical protein
MTVTTPRGILVDWLGVSEKGGVFEVRYQPPGGHVYQVKDCKLDGSRLTLKLEQGVEWELAVKGDEITGVQKRGANVEGQVAGARAPTLNRLEPQAWTVPERLFNGRDLSGWEPVEAHAANHWLVRNNELINEERGANLKTTRKFDDFRLHIDYNCPEGGNSGIYLRGRYEVQIEYEPLGANPPERAMGSIYGFLTPAVILPRTPGEWESYDIELVGRTVTVVRDGSTILDHKEIPGVTGGALDSREGEPGPIYIQGDHTGSLRFRDITVAVPK